MNYAIHRISLDVNDDAPSQKTITAKQGDNAKELIISLLADKKNYIIKDDCVAYFTANKPNGETLNHECEIKDNKIHYIFHPSTVSVSGKVDCEVSIVNSEGEKLTTSGFTIMVVSTIFSEKVNGAKADITILTELIGETNKTLKEGKETLAELKEYSELNDIVVQEELDEAVDEINLKIDTLHKNGYIVVDSLPEVSSETVGKIYLVLHTEKTEYNIYDEYITISVDGVYTWEKIGSTEFKLVVDNALSDTSTNPVENKVIKEALDGKLDRQPVTDNSGYKVYLENPNGAQEMRYVGGRQNYIAKYFGETNGKDGSVETIGLAHLLTNIPQQPYQATNKNYVDKGMWLPAYDETATYSIGNMVTSDGKIYKSLIDNNKGNALTDTASWEDLLSGKLDKVTTALYYTRVYAVDGNGKQALIGTSVEPYQYRLAQYMPPGTVGEGVGKFNAILKVGTPIIGNDATNKDYVDTEITKTKDYVDTEIIKSTLAPAEMTLVAFKLSTANRYWQDFNGYYSESTGSTWEIFKQERYKYKIVKIGDMYMVTGHLHRGEQSTPSDTQFVVGIPDIELGKLNTISFTAGVGQNSLNHEGNIVTVRHYGTSDNVACDYYYSVSQTSSNYYQHNLAYVQIGADHVDNDVITSIPFVWTFTIEP